MMDRRESKSRKNILNALVRLLRRTPWEKIHIVPIAAEANLTRQVVSAHYKTKEDIIAYFLTRDDTGNAILSITSEPESGTGGKIVVTYNSKSITENRDNFKVLLADNGVRTCILQHINERIADVLAAHQKTISPEIYKEYEYELPAALVAGFTAVLKWFKDDMPIPLEDLVSRINKMFLSSMCEVRINRR